ncbi:MAG: hypothetical protein WBA16_08995 [Nonlabens sp.]
MKLEDFVKEIEQEIEELPPNSLTADQDYRQLDAWSSMYALIIIAFITVNHQVTLTAADLKSTNTVRDLYELVKSRKTD